MMREALERIRDLDITLDAPIGDGARLDLACKIAREALASEPESASVGDGFLTSLIQRCDEGHDYEVRVTHEGIAGWVVNLYPVGGDEAATGDPGFSDKQDADDMASSVRLGLATKPPESVEPVYCCDGRECGCMGLPIEPPSHPDCEACKFDAALATHTKPPEPDGVVFSDGFVKWTDEGREKFTALFGKHGAALPVYIAKPTGESE